MDNVMKLGLILSATDKMSRVVDQAVGKTTKKLKSLATSMNHISHGSMIAGGVIVAGAFHALKEAEKLTTAQTRLDNVFKQMWGSSGAVKEASKNAKELAERLSLQIGVEEDVIMLTQAKLATFENVSSKTAMMNHIFERATKAAHDMAAVGFGEASQNAVMLGKALQDPMRMVTALKKQGTVTAQDIINIQGIYKSQGLLAAQKEILRAVERQVKDTGIATAKATDIMKVGFGHVVEEIGMAFLPSADKAKNKMASFLPKVLEWIKHNHKLIQTIAKIGIGLLAFGVAMKVVATSLTAFATLLKLMKILTYSWNIVLGINAFLMKAMPVTMKTNAIALHGYAFAQKIAVAAQWLFNTALFACPIVWIIAAVIALGVAIYMLVKHWKAIVNWVMNSNSIFAKLLRMYILPIIIGFKAMRSAIVWVIGAFKTMVNWVKTSDSFFARLIRYNIKSMVLGFKALKTAIGWVWDKLKGLWELIKKFTGATLAPLVKVINFFSKKTQAQLGVNVNNNSTSNTPKSIATAQNMVKSTSNNYQASTNMGGPTINYAPVVNIGSGSVQDKQTFGKMLQDHKREVLKVIQDNKNNNARVSFAGQ